MVNNQTVRDVQLKILEIIKYIDSICREYNIEYYIMGGTALGAIRHGGFIPWDDDLDIFMTPAEYKKFKAVFEQANDKRFFLQEWKITDNYLEYAKVRMNNTTFIEKNFVDRPQMHHGIFVDIMILHKVPKNKLLQRIVYYKSKYVTLYALSQRNWIPKNKAHRFGLALLKVLPNKWLSKICYKHIYKYDNLYENFMYCYWITPAGFKQGLFDAEFFSFPIDVKFEDTNLLGSKKIKEYLEYRYGNYMKMPSKEAQKKVVHACYFDVNEDYKEYFKKQ